MQKNFTLASKATAIELLEPSKSLNQEEKKYWSILVLPTSHTPSVESTAAQTDD